MADRPVLHSTKFDFVLNLKTAHAIGIEVRPGVISIAGEVIAQASSRGLNAHRGGAMSGLHAKGVASPTSPRGDLQFQ